MCECGVGQGRLRRDLAHSSITEILLRFYVLQGVRSIEETSVMTVVLQSEVGSAGRSGVAETSSPALLTVEVTANPYLLTGTPMTSYRMKPLEPPLPTMRWCCGVAMRSIQMMTLVRRLHTSTHSIPLGLWR